MCAAPSSQPRAYNRVVLRSLLPAVGWQAVYVAETGEHFLMPVYALGLIARRWYDVETQLLLPSGRWDGQEDEDWEIVGLDYSPVDDWGIVNEDGNCCGLLPPGWTIADFEASKRCAHLTKKQHGDDHPAE